MLAQNFKLAAELQITEQQLRGLVLVLGALERGELNYSLGVPDVGNGFNMANHFANVECGTVGCIAGWAEHFMGMERGDILNIQDNDAIECLFAGGAHPSQVTPAQAAIALRSYLTTGKARWDLAVAS